MASFTQNNARDPKNKFSKYLLLKHEDTTKKIRDENPFDIYRDLKCIIPKKNFFKVRPQSNGNLVIEVDKKETHDKLLQVKKLGKVPVNIQPHTTMNQCKGTIFCDNIPKMTDEQILEEIKDQDVAEVYRTKRRDDKNNLVSTSLFIITFDKTTLPNEVKIGYMNCKVRVYIPNPRICFNCMKFGHGRNTCSHESVCAKCAHSGPDHPDYEECENDLKCANCHGDHPATSKQCPMYKLEKKIMERKIRYNLTYPQAREQIYLDEPELVSQVPTIKRRKAPQTYSTVTASTSATDILNQQQAKLIMEQQQQIKQMQQQIVDLTILLKGQINSSQMPSTSNDNQSTKDSKNESSVPSKRPLGEDSASSDEEAASREEVSPQQAGGKRVCNRVNGNPPNEDVPAVEMVDESGRLNKPPFSSKIPTVPPDKNVKENVRSGSSGDRRGAVSNNPKMKPKPIKPPK